LKTKSFSIPIIPRPQKRARSRAVKAGNGEYYAQVYKCSKQKREEDNFRALLYEHKPPSITTGPVYLFFIAYLPRPKNHYGTGRNAGQVKASSPEYHTSKPDLDNLTKHLKDCMTGIFYQDDKQIVKTQAVKRYSSRPRWEITFIELEV